MVIPPGPPPPPGPSEVQRFAPSPEVYGRAAAVVSLEALRLRWSDPETVRAVSETSARDARAADPLDGSPSHWIPPTGEVDPRTGVWSPEGCSWRDLGKPHCSCWRCVSQPLAIQRGRSRRSPCLPGPSGSVRCEFCRVSCRLPPE